MTRARRVIVTGDVMVDWNIGVQRQQGAAERSWAAAGKVVRSWQPGGAALFADVIAAFDARWNVARVAEPQDAAGEHQTFTMLAPSSGEDGDVWRVKEFLGVQRSTSAGHVFNGDDKNADVVAILDAGMGFHRKRAAWPRAITGDGEPWIVLKTCALAFDSDLWKLLIKKHAERLIVVATVDDLRRMEIEISRHISWEASAEDLIRELRHSPVVNALSESRHVVISFGTVGAAVYAHRGNATLLFDPENMESEWERADDGTTMGNTTILAAAIVRHLMMRNSTVRLDDAILRGIAGMRALYNAGYGSAQSDAIVFPTAVVAKAVKAGPEALVTARIPIDDDPKWSILTGELNPHDVPRHLLDVAESIVRNGFDSLGVAAPRERIGKLFAIDRREIEPLRSIKSLLKEYLKQRTTKPLSIAVFGPPGAGKSFGVVEIAKAIAPKDVEVLTFNISQLAHPNELHGAFHQVRDLVLSGKTPIVFWDEFDSPLQGQQAGWLRYFLAPMQDGTFQQGEVTHPIGKCVFVFAGGTAHTIADFALMFGTRQDKARAAKLPDFRSRIRGYLNVAGPNPADGDDGFYIVRRALLLRSMLERHAEKLFAKPGGKGMLQIDRGVLRAFLSIGKYKHGARSMEALIHMSTLADRNAFERSRLPSEKQLDLHVDTVEFMRLVEQPEFDDEALEAMAEVAHSTFCKTRRKFGWTYDAVRDDAQKKHNLLVDYDLLPPWAKEMNREFVRSIPRKLKKLGYAMTPRPAVDVVTALTREQVERLAPEEHDEYMGRKVAALFKQHRYFVPWTELLPEMQETDKSLLRAIPKILAAGGYTIVRLKP